MFTTTRGLVIREVKYKESDKLLTVLTDTEGKLTVSARGARKKGCKYAAATQLFAFSEMTLFGNKGRWSLNEAETQEQFLGLRGNITSLALASYFAEALEAVSDEDMPNPRVLQLGLNSLYALSRGMYSEKHIKAAFEMRLMCLSGYEPDVSGCSVCGDENPNDPRLGANSGMVYCRKCTPVGEKTYELCADSLAALRHIIYSPAKRVFSFTLGEKAEDRLAKACENYMLHQSARGFSALDYYKSL